MASLKITRASGEIICKITPVIEMAFEKKYNCGIHKKFRDDEMSSDLYWLSWDCLRRLEVVDPWGDAFLETLIAVEVIEDTDPKP